MNNLIAFNSKESCSKNLFRFSIHENFHKSLRLAFLHRSADALRRVVRSLSYGGPALGPARLERLLAEVDALGEREGREWARVLRLSWLRRGRRSRPTRTRPPRP